jgi:ankyrin repeat protein
LTTQVEDVVARVAADRAAEGVLNQYLGELRGRGGPGWRPSLADIQEGIRVQREAVAVDRAVDPSDLVTRSMKQAFGESTVPQDRLPIREMLVRKTGGLTALQHAARVGNVAAALALLDGGANVDQVSAGDGSTALVLATLNGHWDLALALLKRGADPNLATSTDGVAPLFAVLQTQWGATTLYPQPRAQDVQKAEYMEVLTALLDAGANANVGLKTHLWSWEYNEARLGTDLVGATPFWRATYAQDLEAMKLLVAHGADPHTPTLTPPIWMRENRQQDGRQEDSFSGVDAPYVPEGAPALFPIHGAAGGGYLGIGAYTVSAVPDGFMPAVKYLVEELGADVNAVDWWGYRPLHYAASRGDNEMISYLVSKGADVTVLTRMGQSVADMARGGQGGFFQRVEYPETVKLTQSLGAELECLHVHFSGTGDQCAGAGKTEFEQHLADWDWRYKRPATAPRPVTQSPR